MAHREKWTTQSAPHTYRLGESQNEASRLTQTCVQRTGCGTSRLSIHDQGIDYFTLEQLTPMIPAAFREPLRSSRPTGLAVPAQKSIRSRNLFAGNAARPGFSARAGPHRYSLAQAILPIGLPAAGGRRIGRWT